VTAALVLMLGGDARAGGAIAVAGEGGAVGIESVVVAANADVYERKAAAEIADGLKRITGVALPVSPAAGRATRGRILVGRAALNAGVFAPKSLARLSRDGYAIRAGDGRVGIAGYRGVGTLMGAYAFLGRLGVRIYAADCRVVPSSSTLFIPAMDASDVPAFDFRGGFDAAGIPELGFTPAEDSPPATEIDPRCGAGWDHTASYQLPKYLFYAAHPEYYARDEAGKNIAFNREMDVQLCLSNREVRRIAAGRVLEWMKKEPQGTWFCLTQGDGSSWCRCPRCRALDPHPGLTSPAGEYPAGLSDRLLSYVNAIAARVAEKHPDKILLTLAYTPATQPPPERVKPARNVKVMFCPYPTPDGALCNSHDLFCPRNTGALRDLLGWLKWCPESVYIYDYPTDYAVGYQPTGTFWAMARKIKFYASHGIRGIYFCDGPRLFGRLFAFVMGRLLWHPEADADALANEFMAAYYGPAAPRVREYFDLLYDRVDDHAAPFHTYCEGSNPGLVTPAFAAKAYGIFDRAKAAVKDDPILLERVRYEELCGVLWSDLDENTKTKLVTDGRVNPALLAKARKLVDICAARGIEWFARGDRDNAWIRKALGIPVGDGTWYEDPLLKRVLSGEQVDAAALERLMAQKPAAGGIEILLSGFSGAEGPQAYDYHCPSRTAIWIRPGGGANSAMTAAFYLDKVPAKASLVVEALDDDKPGATQIRITVNDRVVFAGKNGAKEDDWTPLSFPVPAGVLRTGRNALRIEDIEESDLPAAKWFMISAARLLLD